MISSRSPTTRRGGGRSSRATISGPRSICLQGSQGIGPVRDDGADGIVVVLAGEVATQVGKGRARMKQWQAVEVPAGVELTVRNASEEPSVVLLVVAPPPG